MSGDIENISAFFTFDSLLGICTVALGGSLNGVTYNSDAGVLDIPVGTSTLAIDSTSGECAGVVGPGDGTTFQASYPVVLSG